MDRAGRWVLIIFLSLTAIGFLAQWFMPH